MLALLLALAQAAPPHDHGTHGPDAGHGHGAQVGDDATVHHRFDDAEKWAKVFNDPERDAWQKPVELVAALGLEPGHTVADIGAGTGYFNPHLARAVGPDGAVIAIDVEQSLVDFMEARSKEAGLTQVVARLGKPDDPGLRPAEADRILLVDTYHHLSDRRRYFGALVKTLRPGGHLVVVDFKPGELPVGPGPEHKIPRDQVVAELEAAGWRLVAEPDLLPYQFVLDLEPAAK